jgi:hypothetical protein
MHNKQSSSSQIFLNGKFEQKSVDEIKIDAPDELSPLTALDIGHDNSGISPRWYLNKVCFKEYQNYQQKDTQGGKCRFDTPSTSVLFQHLCVLQVLRCSYVFSIDWALR